MSDQSAKLDILSKHYSDTFNILQNQISKRDKLFLWIIVLILIMSFQIYTPEIAASLISQIIVERLLNTTPINFLYIQSLIWFVFLALTIKYFQAVIYIERQYSYLSQLEELLSQEFDHKAFTREGVEYNKDYPIFLNWASFLYTILFPLILITVSTTKIINEFHIYGCCSALVLFNFLLYVFATISIGLYLYVLHIKKRE